MNPNLLTLSHATYVGPSGATAAATYAFFTKGYRLPAETRHIEFDVVHNQNGRFKYVYDNGPGFKRWPPITISCQDKFIGLIGANAATQYQRAYEMWNHKGLLGLAIAGATYQVHWSQEAIDNAFIVFPVSVGDQIENDITLQFEEA